MMSVLSIKNLSKSFGTNKVIDNISFEVPEGSVFGFIGANGAGKTTTMKMILGLLPFDSGEIYVCGEKVSFGATKTNRFIGYLPDVPEFYGYMRPKEYLYLCGEVVGLNSEVIKQRTSYLLEKVGLADVTKRIKSFSRGMKQRLGVAQALFNEPKLLICDEPTSALDPIGRKEILDILKGIRGNTTVIFSTHILADVERICDRLAVLHNSNIVLESAISDLKLERKSRTVELEFANEIDPQKVLQVLTAGNLIPMRCEAHDAEISLESLYLEVIE